MCSTPMGRLFALHNFELKIEYIDQNKEAHYLNFNMKVVLNVMMFNLALVEKSRTGILKNKSSSDKTSEFLCSFEYLLYTN